MSSTGSAHDSLYDYLAASRLLGLAKPDGGVRPIAIADTLGRLAERIICRDKEASMLEYFAPPPPQPTSGRPAGAEGSVPTKTPLQFGVGIKGGMEACVHTVRLLLAHHARIWSTTPSEKLRVARVDAVDRSARLPSSMRPRSRTPPWTAAHLGKAPADSPSA